MIYWLTRSTTLEYRFWRTEPEPWIYHQSTRSNDVSMMWTGGEGVISVHGIEEVFPLLEIPKGGGIVKLDIIETDDGYMIEILKDKPTKIPRFK